MANPNVIDYAPFGKPAAVSYALTNNQSPTTNNCVCEPDAEYGDDLTTKLAALLEMPAWPQFPDGAYLNPTQAARLYRAVQGIQGITHILDRSAHARDLTKDYDHEPDHSLSETQEAQLRCALIEIGTELVALADDLHQRALENLRQ